MYKKACCTYKLIVLRNKPIALLTSSLPSPSPSSLLKLPISMLIRGLPRTQARSSGFESDGILVPRYVSWERRREKRLIFLFHPFQRLWRPH